MSTKAKAFFLGSCIFSSVVIYKVHEYQEDERKRMRAGVYKDIERQKSKKASTEAEDKKLHNIQMLNEQAKLHDILTDKSK